MRCIESGCVTGQNGRKAPQRNRQHNCEQGEGCGKALKRPSSRNGSVAVKDGRVANEALALERESLMPANFRARSPQAEGKRKQRHDGDQGQRRGCGCHARRQQFGRGLEPAFQPGPIVPEGRYDETAKYGPCQDDHHCLSSRAGVGALYLTRVTR
jgi:hypothetical protein